MDINKEEILAQNFSIIGNEFKKIVAKDSSFKSDCSIKDCKIIEFLFSGPKTMSELSHEMQITPGTMTSAIDKLIEGKYVKRVYDKDDRRRVSIELLAKGKKVASYFHEKHLEISSKILKTLNPEEQAIFIDITRKIVHNLSK